MRTMLVFSIPLSLAATIVTRLRFTLCIVMLAGLLAGLVLGNLPSEAQAGEPIRLRYANFPAASTFPCVQMERWAQEIQRRTSNQVRIETYPGGTLLEARAILRGVMRGQADIGCISLAYHPGSFPFFNLFGLPLGFTSAADASVVLNEIYAAYSPKELEPFKVLLMFASSPSQIMSTEPMNTLEDLKGQTLRASGSLSDVLQALGGQTVSIPMSETPEALQKGVVKGVFSSWDTLRDLNYAERCHYGLTVNMPVYPFVVVMNKKTWERLPADVQTAMDALAVDHARWTGEYVDQWGQDALGWAKETHGFTLQTLPEADALAMQDRLAPLLLAWKQTIAAQGIDGEAVIKTIYARRDALAQNNTATR